MYFVAFNEGQVHRLGDELADGALAAARRAGNDPEVVVSGGGAIARGEDISGGQRRLDHGWATLVGQHSVELR